MAANKYTKALIAAGIQDGLLRDFMSRELWLCVPAEIDNGIDRREKQIEALKAMRVEIEEERGHANTEI